MPVIISFDLEGSCALKGARTVRRGQGTCERPALPYNLTRTGIILFLWGSCLHFSCKVKAVQVGCREPQPLHRLGSFHIQMLIQ